MVFLWFPMYISTYRNIVVLGKTENPHQGTGVGRLDAGAAEWARWSLPGADEVPGPGEVFSNRRCFSTHKGFIKHL